MRILVISNLYPPHGIGGYEERCLHTVNALIEQGHSVDVLTSNHHTDAPSNNTENHVHRNLRIHGFYGHPWLPIHHLYHLEKHNQDVLHKTLKICQPDVVQVWNMGGISKSLLHTLENIPTPLVYDISDHWIARSLKADVWLSWWNQKGSFLRNTCRKLASISGAQSLINKRVPTTSIQALKFEHIYFCSRYMRDTTSAKGYPVAHADIVYCGVETDDFAKKTAFSTPRNFIWVGRLAEDKDPLTTIRGFLLAREKSGHEIHLDIYGKGSKEYTSFLQDTIEHANAQNFITLKSATHRQMRQIYANYDAYIFSSNWGEPFALTPLEAMSANLPVIMCPDGGDAELLQDGINAIAFQSANPDSLSAAINQLLQLPDHGAAMAERALNLVNEKFTIRVMTAQIEQILKQVVQPK